MIRIARYSSPRSSLLALSVTVGFVLVLFVASFVTHLPSNVPEQTNTIELQTTVHTNNFEVPTSINNLNFIYKVIQL